MNCPEAESLLEAFHDGELDGRLMRDTAIHLAGCTRCVARLDEYERVHALVEESVEAELSGFDAGQVWAGISEALEPAPSRQSTWRGFRLAAASTKVRGVLVGGPAEDESGNDSWLAPAVSGSTASRTVFFGGGMALAASLLFAFVLLGEEEAALAPGDGPGQVAAVSAPTQPAPSARVPSPPHGVAAAFPSTRAPVQHAQLQQVQIHSLNDFGGEMAMWAEPAGDTAVIWLGETAPRARR
jgi:hypothetical protein